MPEPDTQMLPTREDQAHQRAFLTADWRDLVLLNYAVDPALLAPLVPFGTELDSFDGTTYLSLVGFRFLHTRVLGFRVPFHQNFDEVNLRFYVRRKSPEGMRRGVVFVREIVPLRAVAAVARLAFAENYIRLPMSHRILPGESGREQSIVAEYRWRWKRDWNSIRVETSGPPYYPVDESAEHFISEHYWGYARQPDGGCLEYQVRHPQWKVWRTRYARYEGDAEPLYGAEFARLLSGQPASAFLAEGSPVVVHKGAKIR